MCDKVACQSWCESQPSVTSATPATHSEGGCRQAPHLPRKATAGHAKWRGVTGDQAAQVRPSVPSEPAQAKVPRLPRKTKVEVTKGHAHHTKRRWMSPSATLPPKSGVASLAPKPRHQSQPSAISAMPVTQNESG